MKRGLRQQPPTEHIKCNMREREKVRDMEIERWGGGRDGEKLVSKGQQPWLNQKLNVNNARTVWYLYTH